MIDIKNLVKKVEVYCGIEFRDDFVDTIIKGDLVEKLKLLTGLIAVVSVENEELSDETRLQLMKELIVYNLSVMGYLPDLSKEGNDDFNFDD